MSPEPGQRYRFGPRERGGGIAGWRTGQIVTVAIGLLLGVLTLRWQPDAAGVAAAIVILVLSGALATVPVAGRTGTSGCRSRRAGRPAGRAGRAGAPSVRCVVCACSRPAGAAWEWSMIAKPAP